jgi:hypothetical protein
VQCIPKLETLEQREVPTVQSVGIESFGGIPTLAVRCVGGPDTVTLDHGVDGAGGYATFNGGATRFHDGSYHQMAILGGTGGLTANLHANVKLVELFPYPTPCSAPYVINVGDASNHVHRIQAPLELGDLLDDHIQHFHVYVNDQGDSQFRNPTVDFTGGDEKVAGLGAADVRPASTCLADLTLSTGTGGAAVNVRGTVPNAVTSVIGHGSNNDTVNVGNPTHGARDIQGELRIDNPPSLTTVNVDDSADTSPRTVTHDTWTPAFDPAPWGRITGLAPALITYEYADTSAATLQTGPGGGTVNVQATGAALVLVNNGSSTVTVGDASGVQDTLAPLTVNGAPGATSLQVFNDADPQDRQVSYGVLNGQGGLDGLSATARIAFDPATLNALYLRTGSGVTTFQHYPGATDFPPFTVFDSAGGTNVFI